MKQVTKYVLLSQASFLAFIIICIAIMPGYLFETNEGGMSNYGVHIETASFYTAAFMSCSFFLFKAKQVLPQTGQTKTFAYALVYSAVSLLVILLSTYVYKINRFFTVVHIGLSSLILFSYLVIITMLLFKNHKSWAVIVIYTSLLAGLLLATLTLLGIYHVLFIAQLLILLSYGGLLILFSEQTNVASLKR